MSERLLIPTVEKIDQSIDARVIYPRVYSDYQNLGALQLFLPHLSENIKHGTGYTKAKDLCKHRYFFHSRIQVVRKQVLEGKDLLLAVLKLLRVS